MTEINNERIFNMPLQTESPIWIRYEGDVNASDMPRITYNYCNCSISINDDTIHDVHEIESADIHMNDNYTMEFKNGEYIIIQKRTQIEPAALMEFL